MVDDPVTFDEFYRCIPDGQKADLLDGVIHWSPPDTLEANQLMGWLMTLVAMYVSERDLGGQVLFSRFACRIDEWNAVEPDVLYLSPEREHLLNNRYLDGSPDLAIEIVSRGSRERDFQDKRDLYERAGVREYWIIDPVQSHVAFLQLIGGELRQVALEQNRIFHSEVLSGFWLDVDWLFRAPLPNAYEVFRLVLQGPPKK